MRLNFQKGFNDYLTETEIARLDNTVADLSNAYRQEGSWGASAVTIVYGHVSCRQITRAQPASGSIREYGGLRLGM